MDSRLNQRTLGSLGRSILPLGAIWLAGACGGSAGDGGGGPNPPPPTPAELVKESGDNQSAVAGTAVPAPLIVVVRDSAGRPIAGVTVSFAVTGGGGRTGSTTVVTQSNGKASAIWTLGTAVGNNTLSAAVANLPAVSFSATAAPGPQGGVMKLAGDLQVAGQAFAALAPIRVKVIDRFGNAVPGVGVTWTPPPGHGTVQTATGTTDQHGEASTVWTLGRLAGQDSIQLRVANLPNPIVFTASLVPTQLTLVPDSVTFWPGDSALLQARLSDADGDSLVPQQVLWSTGSPAVAAIGASGLLRAVGEGHATITLSMAGLVRATAVVVGSRFLGQVFPADSSDPSSLRVFVRSICTDSADVQADGRFELRTSRPLTGQTGDLYIDARDLSQRAYLPSLRPNIALNAAEAIVAVMVPRAWRIRHGRFAGLTIPVSMNAILGNGWVPADVYQSGVGGVLWSWRDAEFPIPIVIDRLRSIETVTAQDSVNLWLQLDEMEARYGLPLFRRADWDSLPKDTVINTITGLPVLFPHKAMSVNFGLSGVPANAGVSRDCSKTVNPFTCLPVGEIKWATFNINVFITQNSQATTHHEAYHALGFGHNCFWPSIMGPGNGCTDKSLTPDSLYYGSFSEWPPVGLTEYDVAYAHLHRSITSIARATNATWGVKAAMDGERVLLLGVPVTSYP